MRPRTPSSVLALFLALAAVLGLTPPASAGGTLLEGMRVVLDASGDGQGHELRYPRIAHVDGRGNVFVTGFQSENVFRVSPDGRVTLMLGPEGDGRGTDLSRPRGLASDSEGNLYVASEGTHVLFKVTPEREVSILIGPEGDGKPVADGRFAFNRPTEVVVGPDDAIYVSAQNSNIVYRRDPDGTLTRVMQSGDGGIAGFRRPNGLALDGKGNLYAVTARPARLYRATPEGEVTVLVDGPKGGDAYDLLFANGVEADAAGNVYVTGNNSGNVLHVAPDGTVREVIPRSFEGHVLGAPTALALAKDGSLFLARTGPFGVWRLDPAGGIHQVLSPDHVSDDRGRMGTRGLAVLPGGDLVVPVGFANRVVRIEAATARAARPASFPHYSGPRSDDAPAADAATDGGPDAAPAPRAGR